MNPISKAFLYIRQAYIRSHLEGEKILDVGSSYFKIRKDAYSIDLKRHKRPNVQGSVISLPFASSTFDTVVFAEVIEHIPHNLQKAALKEIRRILKPKGKLIISMPSLFPTWKIVWFVWSHTVQKEYQNDHIGELSVQELYNILGQNGFRYLESKRVMLYDHIVVCN